MKPIILPAPVPSKHRIDSEQCSAGLPSRFSFMALEQNTLESPIQLPPIVGSGNLQREPAIPLSSPTTSGFSPEPSTPSSSTTVTTLKLEPDHHQPGPTRRARQVHGHLLPYPSPLSSPDQKCAPLKTSKQSKRRGASGTKHASRPREDCFLNSPHVDRDTKDLEEKTKKAVRMQEERSKQSQFTLRISNALREGNPKIQTGWTKLGVNNMRFSPLSWSKTCILQTSVLYIEQCNELIASEIEYLNDLQETAKKLRCSKASFDQKLKFIEDVAHSERASQLAKSAEDRGCCDFRLPENGAFKSRS